MWRRLNEFKKFTLNAESSPSSHVLCESRVPHLVLKKYSFSKFTLKVNDCHISHTKCCLSVYQTLEALPMVFPGKWKPQDAAHLWKWKWKWTWKWNRFHCRYQDQHHEPTLYMHMNMTYVHVAILKNHPYRPLLQLFRGGFCLHPGVSKPPHECGGRVPPSRRATDLWWQLSNSSKSS